MIFRFICIMVKTYLYICTYNKYNEQYNHRYMLLYISVINARWKKKSNPDHTFASTSFSKTCEKSLMKMYTQNETL